MEFREGRNLLLIEVKERNFQGHVAENELWWKRCFWEQVGKDTPGRKNMSKDIEEENINLFRGCERGGD